MPIASLARKFLLQHDFTNKVIFGVKNRKHVDDIIEDLHSKILEKELIDQILHLYKKDFNLDQNQRKLGY